MLKCQIAEMKSDFVRIPQLDMEWLMEANGDWSVQKRDLIPASRMREMGEGDHEE